MMEDTMMPGADNAPETPVTPEMPETPATPEMPETPAEGTPAEGGNETPEM